MIVTRTARGRKLKPRPTYKLQGQTGDEERKEDRSKETEILWGDCSREIETKHRIYETGESEKPSELDQPSTKPSREARNFQDDFRTVTGDLLPTAAKLQRA